MIQVSNLSKSYGNQVLFRQVSFTVNRGERIGLVGRNGHGKTTLFRLLLDQEEPDEGTITIPRLYTIGYLSQEITFSKKTVLDEACTVLGEDWESEQWRVEKILTGLGFGDQDLDLDPMNLAGGYQVRLNLAKVLASEPGMLLLDEPTNYLDIQSIRWLVRFLNEWKGELMVITHDRSFMDRVTTHTLGIHRQKVRKIKGNTWKLYEQILKEEETYEQTRMNDEKKRKEMENYIRKFRAKARLASMVQSRVKMLEKMQKPERLQKLQTLEFSFRSEKFEARQMAEIHDLKFAYPGTRRDLLGGLSFSVGRQDRICVIGRNGKGKSTLLKLMADRLVSDAGKVSYHPLLKVNYLAQSGEGELDSELKIVEEIQNTGEGCNFETAMSICGAMMFDGDAAYKKVSVLSGGEKSRVLLGKMLLSPSHLLLLDEPTNHLDMESSDALLEAIDQFNGSVIMVTHNEEFLHSIANRLIVFDRNGTYVHEGSYQDFLDRIGWEDEEEDDRAFQPSTETGREVRFSGDRQELKKERARLIQQRYGDLTPLEETIRRLEQEIQNLEEEEHANTQGLVDASQSGDAGEIASLSRRNRQIGDRLNDLYEELDRATSSYEKKCEYYENVIAALDES